MKLKDKKIQIFAQRTKEDENGVKQPKLRRVGLPVWAYFRQLSGREKLLAGLVLEPEEEVLFTINYRTDIDTTNVIGYKGKLYDVVRVDVFEGYKKDITLYCKTR
ncbi:MAG: phage head closure protein [Clostridia bacterium]|nr:phage head closure protein [Clostridia bacterium]